MLQMLMMRARCHRVARVLQGYLDGEIDPSTATLVSEHLEECRRCGLEASTYAAIKTVIAASDAARPATVDPAVVRRLDEFARRLSHDSQA